MPEDFRQGEVVGAGLAVLGAVAPELRAPRAILPELEGGSGILASGTQIGKLGVEAAEGMSSPSLAARALQGDGFYPGVDRFRDITLKEGTVIYAGEPGITGFATTRSAFARTGNDAQRIFEGLQVGPKLRSYRPGMTEYVVIQDTPAAFGIVRANTQFGAGELPQLYIENLTAVTRPTISYPLINRAARFPK